MRHTERVLAGIASTIFVLAAHAASAATPQEQCIGNKNSAAGKLVSCVTKALKTYYSKGDLTKYAASVTKCETKYAASWQKAENAAVAAGSSCLTTDDDPAILSFVDACMDAVGATNRNCYRAQCYATTRLVAAELGLDEGSYSTTFQSRLKGKKWIEPYTDVELPRLHAGGVRRLAVLSPAFTADCLETLEELGVRGRTQWTELGGEDFLLVPCLNAHDRWASAVADLIRRAV